MTNTAEPQGQTAQINFAALPALVTNLTDTASELIEFIKAESRQGLITVPAAEAVEMLETMAWAIPLLANKVAEQAQQIEALQGKQQ